MGSAAVVVAREDGLNLRHTLIIGLLQASKECLVQVGLVFGVTVAPRDNAGVNALVC